MPLPNEFWRRLKAAEKKMVEGAPAYKNDEEKLRYDLIPPAALEAYAAVLTYGAKKYEDRNWEKGMGWGRMFGAAMRHLWAWWWGRRGDPDTALTDLAHAIFCVGALLHYEAHRIGQDDRPAPAPEYVEIERASAQVTEPHQRYARAVDATIMGMTAPRADVGTHDPAKYAERRCACAQCVVDRLDRHVTATL